MPAPRYYNNSSCPPSVFSVVGVLHWFKRNKGSVYPSQAQLSRATGLPTRTVKWAIAWMVREQWIAVIRSDHARGHHLPNAYLIFVEDSRKPLKKNVFSRCPSVQGSLSSGVGFDSRELEKPLVLGCRARARDRGNGISHQPRREQSLWWAMDMLKRRYLDSVDRWAGDTSWRALWQRHLADFGPEGIGRVQYEIESDGVVRGKRAAALGARLRERRDERGVDGENWFLEKAQDVISGYATVAGVFAGIDDPEEEQFNEN